MHGVPLHRWQSILESVSCDCKGWLHDALQSGPRDTLQHETD